MARCLELTIEFLGSLRSFFGYEVDPTALINGDGLRIEEGIWVYKFYFQREKSYKRLKTYPYAVKVLREFLEDYELIFVSCRPKKMLDLTIKNLKRLKIYRGNLFLVPRDQKVDFIIKLKPDFVIEDEARLANKIGEGGIKCFLLERPWNIKEKVLPCVRRVKSWQGIALRVNKGRWWRWYRKDLFGKRLRVGRSF